MKCFLIPLLLFSPLAAHPGHEGPHEAKPKKPSVVAVVYSDFHCEPCTKVSALIDRLIKEKEQSINVLFKHAPTKPEALQAHEASLAAAQQGKFWEMHDLLFKNRGANYSEILKMAKSLDLDVKRFQTGLDERLFRSRVISDLTEATGMGVRNTPTVFINGQKFEGIDQFKAFVEQVLAPPKNPMDPNKIYEFDLNGSPSIGPEDAPITLVEFSDFRCGFCSVHSHNVTDLVAAYPGKIRRVFKHFPIQVNAEGRLPHHGAMAAKAQGEFWRMYHALMKSPLKNRDDLMARASVLGLDMVRFENDLKSQQITTLVQRDITEGDGHLIRMTPTTFINGKVLTGRHSLSSLSKHVDSLLNEKPVTPLDLTPATLGDDLASILIEFYADFADPDSQKIYTAISKFRKERESEVRWEFKHAPSSKDAPSMLAHRCAMAAREQGRFWEMSELIFNFKEEFTQKQALTFASELGLDQTKFSENFNDSRFKTALIEAEKKAANRGLKGKSGIFLNGMQVPQAQDVEALILAMKDTEDCCGKEVAIPEFSQ